MSTVNKEIADRIVAGEFPEDNAQMIVEYDNAFGGVGYGVIFGSQNPDKYLVPTQYVQNPRIYWQAPCSMTDDEILEELK